MLGFEEIIFIAIIAFVLLSPEKLVEFARELGKIYAEYKKAKRIFELEMIYGTISDERLKKEFDRKYKEIEAELNHLHEIQAQK